MKKVSLKHLSKKHDISMSELRPLLVSQWLIKHKDKKVFKKPAKKLIREYLSDGWDTTSRFISRYERMYTRFQEQAWRYTVFGGIALLWLVWWFTSIYQVFADRYSTHNSATVQVAPQAWMWNPWDLPQNNSAPDEERKTILEHPKSLPRVQNYVAPEPGHSAPEILPETGFGCVE